MTPDSPPLDRLRQQLAQLDALIAEGTLKGDAARSARDALEQQVLAAVLQAPPTEPTPAPAAPRPSRALLAGVAAFVLVAGGAGYAVMGNRAGWSVGPGGAAVEADPQQAQIEAMIDTLAERMKTRPDDAEGWTMLARSYTAQGRFALALPAFKRVAELRPRDGQALADYADALAMLSNRSLEGEPERLALQAVVLDPANVKALTLAGTAAFNRDQFAEAIGFWDRAVAAAEPGSDFSRQLKGALAEARQRAGSAPADGAASGVATGPRPMAAAAASVSGRVSLKPGLAGQLGPDATVFIFARAPGGSKMPLAILRRKVGELPLDFTLDDSQAMSPAARLSSVPRVIIGARVSRSGQAAATPGDWQAFSAPVAVGSRGVALEIGEEIR